MFAEASGDETLLKVTISGPPGSGTSTLVSRIASHRGWSSLNGGDVFREEARSRGLSVEQLSDAAKDDLDVDRSLDSHLQKRMSSPDSPEIVESRLSGWWAFKNDLDCIRVWINVSEQERARRIQKREGGDLEACLRRSQKRQSDDMERYSVLYGIDLDDMSPYSLVIDADEKDESEVFQLVNSELGA